MTTLLSSGGHGNDRLTGGAGQDVLFGLLFWLLGASDGHAKNFSVHLSPGGRFRMTPLYDVMSAQPAADANQIRHSRSKLAMSVGENAHCVIDRIAPRHFIEDAATARLPRGMIHGIFDELLAAGPAALDAATKAMPDDCPGALVDSIVSGFQRRLAKVERRAA